MKLTKGKGEEGEKGIVKDIKNKTCGGERERERFEGRVERRNGAPSGGGCVGQGLKARWSPGQLSAPGAGASVCKLVSLGSH